MKKSINQWAFPEGFSLNESLRLAKEAGFEGIELTIAEEGIVNLKTTEEEAKEIVKEVKENGLEKHLLNLQ